MNVLNWNQTEIFTFFFVLVRVTSMMMFLPILGDRVVPATVKILLGLAFAAMVFPVLWGEGMRVDPAIADSVGRLAWTVCGDLGFGMMVGFVARWIFDAVQLAGHFGGTAIGFSIASVLDPHSESQTIALAEMQYLLAAMLFLAMDGHQLYLKATLESFRLVPIGTPNLLANGDAVIQYLTTMTSTVLSLGLKLSAPVVVVVLLINVTFGIMARAVPQMNVMTISFTANIIVGLFVTFVSLPGFINMVGGAFDSFTPELMRFMRLFHG